jgi:hypothetical protein
MAPQITLPHLLVDNVDTALGSDVYGNDKSITDVVNGQLATDNLAPNANIKGGQLSGAVGERVPLTKMEDDAVDARVLKDDPTGVAGAVTVDHVRSAAISKPKLAGAAVSFDKVDGLYQTQAFSFVLTQAYDTAGAGPVEGLVNAGLDVAIGTGNYQAVVRGFAIDQDNITPTTGHLHRGSATVSPPVNIPVATKRLIGCFITGLTYTPATFTLSGTVVFVSISQT